MKNLKKIFVAAGLACVSCMGTAFAEQPKAVEYRAMLASGRYCLEYRWVDEYEDAKLQKRSDKYSETTREIFVADGGKRAILSMGGRHGNGMAMRMESAHAVGKLFRNAAQDAVSLRGAMRLDLLYSDGNYYQFFGRNKALRLSAGDTEDPHADPRAGWPEVRETLAAPGFLAALVLPASEDVRCEGSGTETIFSVPMAVDTYIVRVAPKGETTEPASCVYKYYYDETGNLRYIGVALAGEDDGPGAGGVRQGKGKSLGTYIRVDSFKSDIPDGIFAYPKGHRIYCIRPGSIDDLFTHGTLVEPEKP